MTPASTALLHLAEKLHTAPHDPRLAILFPGQGSQEVGAARDLFESSRVARHLFQRADSILGLPLTRLCFDGPADELRRTDNAQPAILTVSLACFVASLESDALQRRPALLAGHSLGEYTALVAAGALDFEDALPLVYRRGQLMHKAGERQPGRMIALLGLDENQAREVCSLSGCELSNYNSPSQIVIGGPIDAIARAALLTRERRGRSLLLDVSAAFHTSLMAAAAREFASLVRSCPLRDPVVPVIANVTARPLTSADAVRSELEQQLLRPVLWHQSTEFMVKAGVNTFVETGPGRVLSALLKRTDHALTAVTVNDRPSLAALRHV